MHALHLLNWTHSTSSTAAGNTLLVLCRSHSSCSVEQIPLALLNTFQSLPEHIPIAFRAHSSCRLYGTHSSCCWLQYDELFPWRGRAPVGTVNTRIVFRLVSLTLLIGDPESSPGARRQKFWLVAYLHVHGCCWLWLVGYLCVRVCYSIGCECYDVCGGDNLSAKL